MSWSREEYAKRTGLELTDPHHKMLVASAISLDVAAARGYRSAIHQAELRRLGFSSAKAPALVLPMHDVRGELAGYQIRPDVSPVDKEGRPRKYLNKNGSHAVIDVPGPVRHLLTDPKAPLLVTEGLRKADAAASVGLCCLGLLSVWQWRGTNDMGGLTALADWESIALARPVIVVFDSDVMVKESVHLALVRLKAFLEKRKASVRLVYLPPGPHGEKMGLDDWIAAGGTRDQLLALATDEIRQPDVHAADDRPARLRSVGNEETIWYLYFAGHGELELTTDQLYDWDKVAKACMERFNWLPEWYPTKPQWRGELRALMAASKREEGMPGLTRSSRILETVLSMCRNRNWRTDNPADLDGPAGAGGGRVYRKDDHYAVRAKDVIGWCRTSVWPAPQPREIHAVLRRELGAVRARATVPGGQVWVVAIPAAAVDR